MDYENDFDGENEDYYIEDYDPYHDDLLHYEREQKQENEFYQYFKLWDKDHFLQKIEELEYRHEIWTISDYYDFCDIDWTTTENYRAIFERDDLTSGYYFARYLEGEYFPYAEIEMLAIENSDDIPF